MKGKRDTTDCRGAGSLHLQEQVLNLTPPGQFHAGEGDASPYKRVGFHRTPESLVLRLKAASCSLAKAALSVPCRS